MQALVYVVIMSMKRKDIIWFVLWLELAQINIDFKKLQSLLIGV